MAAFYRTTAVKIEMGGRYADVHFCWLAHKIAAGFITYHFIVALRRKTRV